MSAYCGKLLRVNLTARVSSVEDIPLSYYREYISARGLSAKYLYEELRPGTDPLSPDNKLIFSIGVLANTGLQGFSKWAVTSRSPLTGTIFRSISGGNFGPWMKYAGYDLIIIEGKAQQPTYIHIDNSGTHFLDASELVGLDPRSVQRWIKQKHGSHAECACIGAAGENLVKYAVITSGERTASRGGMGTVMGSKNLKAIVINTSICSIEPHDPSTFRALIEKQIEILKSHPRKKNMTTYGTPYITTVVDSLGILPVKNFQEGKIAGIEQISGEEFYKIKKAKAGCHLCMTRCGGMREVTRGPLKGTSIDGPEYETIYAFGPLLGITDKQFTVDANALCDFYGLDTISTGVCIAYIFELFEKGLVSSSDVGNLDLCWGNKEAVFSLIEKISTRSGPGHILAEGVKKASLEFGKDAEAFAMHVKGLELPGYDPRGVKGYALSMATSNIGGSHMYGRPRDELAGKIDPLLEHDKGPSIVKVQKEQALEDSLIACTFGNSGLNTEMYSQLLLAATGIKDFEEPEQLMKIGEKIICIERCFNVREGFTRRDDTLPPRILSEPLRNAGQCTGQSVSNLNGLLNEYYENLGYTKEGIPTKAKLQEFGINDPSQR